MGGGITSLLLAFILSFASCDNSNSASTEPNQVIDITNLAQTKRLIGTWKTEDEYEDAYWNMGNKFDVIIKESEIVVIDSENNVTTSKIKIITKPDGKAFSEEEKNNWHFNGKDSYREDGYKGEDTYRIVTISENGTKITEEVCYGKEPLSEFFQNGENEDGNWYITLALSEDGNILRITYTGTMYGEHLEEYYDYIRQ